VLRHADDRYGDKEEARAMARHNIDLFLGSISRWMRSSPTAPRADRRSKSTHWLADDPAYAERPNSFGQGARRERIPGRDWHPAPAGKLNAVVTYHDPCHLCRAQGVRKQPRDMLRAAASPGRDEGRRYVLWLGRHATCHTL